MNKLPMMPTPLDETTRLRYLQALGIDVWYLKIPSSVEDIHKTNTPANEISIQDLLSSSEPDFVAWLKSKFINELPAGDGSVQFIGNPLAEILVLSYQVNSSKSLQHPFTGKSGILLRSMLRSVDLSFRSVMLGGISNTGSGNQSLEEFIRGKSIQSILLLLNLGSHAENASKEIFLRSPFSLDISPVKVFVSHHPDYLLINPTAKIQVWEVLKNIHRAKQSAL